MEIKSIVFLSRAREAISNHYKSAPGERDLTTLFKQTMHRWNEQVKILAFQTVKLAKNLKPDNENKPSIAFMEDSLHFTGRFDKKLDYDVHFSIIIINKKIVIAACPGEFFVQLQLDWKRKMQLAEVKPFLFGYAWSRGGWPGYIADVRSAAVGGYGADQGDKLIEVGAGETILTHQLVNFYKLNGLMREMPGPTGFQPGAQWVIKPFEPQNATRK